MVQWRTVEVEEVEEVEVVVEVVVVGRSPSIQCRQYRGSV